MQGSLLVLLVAALAAALFGVGAVHGSSGDISARLDAGAFLTLRTPLLYPTGAVSFWIKPDSEVSYDHTVVLASNLRNLSCVGASSSGFALVWTPHTTLMALEIGNTSAFSSYANNTNSSSSGGGGAGSGGSVSGGSSSSSSSSSYASSSGSLGGTTGGATTTSNSSSSTTLRTVAPSETQNPNQNNPGTEGSQSGRPSGSGSGFEPTGEEEEDSSAADHAGGIGGGGRRRQGEGHVEVWWYEANVAAGACQAPELLVRVSGLILDDWNFVGLTYGGPPGPILRVGDRARFLPGWRRACGGGGGSAVTCSRVPTASDPPECLECAGSDPLRVGSTTFAGNAGNISVWNRALTQNELRRAGEETGPGTTFQTRLTPGNLGLAEGLQALYYFDDDCIGNACPNAADALGLPTLLAREGAVIVDGETPLPMPTGSAVPPSDSGVADEPGATEEGRDPYLLGFAAIPVVVVCGLVAGILAVRRSRRTVLQVARSSASGPSTPASQRTSGSSAVDGAASPVLPKSVLGDDNDPDGEEGGADAAAIGLTGGDAHNGDDDGLSGGHDADDDVDVSDGDVGDDDDDDDDEEEEDDVSGVSATANASVMGAPSNRGRRKVRFMVPRGAGADEDSDEDAESSRSDSVSSSSTASSDFRAEVVIV